MKNNIIIVVRFIIKCGCYIYFYKDVLLSDVDGIYTADPNKVDNTQKLKNISYEEMNSLSSEGAKVLHDRCVEIGERNDDILTKIMEIANKNSLEIFNFYYKL